MGWGFTFTAGLARTKMVRPPLLRCRLNDQTLRALAEAPAQRPADDPYALDHRADIYLTEVKKSLGLDFPGRIHGEHSFFGEPGKQHPDRRHVLFDRGRRDLALKAFRYMRPP